MADFTDQRPNFFILGAPKCGTTSLARYLGDHQEIFLTTPKEPNYFARSLATERARRRAPAFQRDLAAYLDLYASATPSQWRRGEASTRNLRCAAALGEIRELSPEARLIAMVRNPVELVQSWHAQKLWEGQETERDLERAWRLEAARRRGEQLPPRLKARDAVFYAGIASLGSQLEQVLGLFPREQLLVILLDDLRDDPQGVYAATLAFLGVAANQRQDFEVHNPRRQNWLERLRQRFGGEGGAPSTPALTPAFAAELVGFFAGEVAKVEAILGRALPAWKVPPPGTA